MCYLTDAGEALVKNDMPPLELLQKLVMENRFPSAFSLKDVLQLIVVLRCVLLFYSSASVG